MNYHPSLGFLNNASMSLRVRLSIIVTLLFSTGMLLGVSLQLSNATSRVSSEVDSTAELTRRMLDALIPLSSKRITDDASIDELVASLRALEDIRHMEIRIEDENRSATVTESSARIDAPAWFVRLVTPQPRTFVHPLGGSNNERIVIRSNPADEIEEVWLESRNILLVLLLILLLVNTMLFFILGRWLKPVQAIVESLEDAEHGNFSGKVPNATLPELKLIADKLNQLTRVLHESHLENDRLTRRSLIIQEEERRFLSQELHDEMGQSISAIKAIAFSLSNTVSDDTTLAREGGQKIAAIAARISERVRTMMSRLRPGVLDDLGLSKALEQMVDDWNDHHDCFCSLRIKGDLSFLDQSQCINLYRIVQEALTNVAKHAAASRVEVTLADDEEAVNLSISDDGGGFDVAATARGMGISGMEERIRALGGSFRLSSQLQGGTVIEASIPRVSGGDTANE